MPERPTVSLDETLVSFKVSAFYTIIPVPVAPEVINKEFTEHTNQDVMEYFLEHTCSILKDKLNSLLKLLLKNCVFSFQGKFYWHLQGAAMGSPVSPIIAHI